MVAGNGCTSRSTFAVAIVGAGVSGSLLALHLLRQLPPTARVALVERREGFGPGLAYSAGSDSYFLNVRASRMSAFSDRPDHFTEWLAHEVGLAPWEADGDSFVPRRLYGAYVQSLLAHELKNGGGAHRLVLFHDEVASLSPEPGGIAVQLGCGRVLSAAKVVLAVGNFPPAPLPLSPKADTGRILPDPWDEAAIRAIPSQANVLIAGSGLTMVDVVLSLTEQGHRGHITALSRRGLLPHHHARVAEPADWADTPWPSSALDLLRLVRGRIRAGQDWRAVIDGLRPHTIDIWQTLPLVERRRFLRHLRPWWDIHRHRLAPQVARRIKEAIDRDRLGIVAGKLVDIGPERRGLEVTWRPRGQSATERMKVSFVVNCAGPESDYRRIRDPLIRSLLDGGTARPDALRLGLDTLGTGQVVGADGVASPHLYAIGPVTRGTFWEVTAVPEIRRHAETLAAHLAREIAPI